MEKPGIWQKYRFNLFFIFIFVLDTVNYSISLIQYGRFRREREYFNRKLELERARDGNVEDPSDESLAEENSSGIINDIKWMLEFNQKGLLHLLLYVLHILVLMIQILKSFLYTTFPLERDPITKEFVNPWLKFCESIYLYDMTSLGFESDILTIRLLGIISLHYLLLRIRALHIKIEAAKINKHRYRKINIVHLNSAFVSEFRFTLSEWFDFHKGHFKHDCKQAESLTGESRKRSLEFNNRVRNLDKIDRYYYFNLIDFDSCSKDSHYLDEYLEKINNLKSNKKKHETTRVSWLRYVFSDNLPNRISYIPQPIFRVDVKYIHGIILVFSYMTISMILCAIIYSVIVTYFILIQNLSPNENPLERLTQVRYIISIVSVCLTILMITFNSYDNGLLVYSVLSLLSRSSKVIMLLKRESNFNRFHLIEFSKFMKRYENRNRVNTINTSRNMSTNIYRSYLEKNQFKMPSLFENSKQMSFIQTFGDRSMFNPTLQSKTVHSFHNIDNPASNNLDDELDFHEICKKYKESSNKQSLECFNENLDYLVDLIEVLRCEFRDLQSFYSTFFNITILFSTVGLSISLAIILNAADSQSIIFGILGGAACLLPMAVTLLIGALNEGIFRRIYRTILPLMVNELNLIEPKVKIRIDKSCEDLAQIENRSFFILGNFPLTFGSLTSMCGWIITSTFLLQRLMD